MDTEILKVWTILCLLLLSSFILVLFIKFRRYKKSYPFDPTETEIKENLIKLKNDGKTFQRTLDDERVFMEDLLIKRFHYLILIFTLFFGASLNISNDLIKSLILLIGSIFCWQMGKVVRRAHYKHHWIMRIIYGKKNDKDITYDDNIKDWKNHPVKIINDAMGLGIRKDMSGGSVSLVNGYFLPYLAAYVLLISTLYFGGNFVIKEFMFAENNKSEIKYLDQSQRIISFKGDKYNINDKDFIIVDDSLKVYRFVIGGRE